MDDAADIIARINSPLRLGPLRQAAEAAARIVAIQAKALAATALVFRDMEREAMEREDLGAAMAHSMMANTCENALGRVPAPEETLNLGTVESFRAVTYAVKDRAGILRDRGIKDMDDAKTAAARVEASEPGAAPCEITRVTHFAFTHREVISR